MNIPRAAERLAFSLRSPEFRAELIEQGVACIGSVLTDADCGSLRAMYDDDALFRSTVRMDRHAFGRGEYRYFAAPTPAPVSELRNAAYGPLASIANALTKASGRGGTWPDTFDGLNALCARVGQTRPTPLLLKYAPGDYNRLHQDLYGEIVFPLQIVFLLSEPGVDYDGGELTLVENRARMQSRPIVPPLCKGGAAVFFSNQRPVRSARGWSSAAMRHGVSEVRRGARMTLGLIFHDAP